MDKYDAVVIGAGNGGLTCAVSLAQMGLNTLLLERHNIPGGCATSFCRGRFEFEVALHQLSGMGTEERPGGLRRMLGSLGVLDDLEFVEMKDLYRAVKPGELDVTIPADRSEAISGLQKQFPHESEGIERFFNLMYRFAGEMLGAFILKDPVINRDKYPTIFSYAFKTFKEVLDDHLFGPAAQGGHVRVLGVHRGGPQPAFLPPGGPHVRRLHGEQAPPHQRRLPGAFYRPFGQVPLPRRNRPLQLRSQEDSRRKQRR